MRAVKHRTFGDLRQVEFILIIKGYLKGYYDFSFFSISSPISTFLHLNDLKKQMYILGNVFGNAKYS